MYIVMHDFCVLAAFRLMFFYIAWKSLHLQSCLSLIVQVQKKAKRRNYKSNIIFCSHLCNYKSTDNACSISIMIYHWRASKLILSGSLFYRQNLQVFSPFISFVRAYFLHICLLTFHIKRYLNFDYSSPSHPSYPYPPFDITRALSPRFSLFFSFS